MESKLIFIVEKDDTYHYFTAIDNITGVAIIHNLPFHTYDDEFPGEDVIINELAAEQGKEILNIVHI